MVRVMEIARDTLTLKIKYSFIFGRLMSTLVSLLINVDTFNFHINNIYYILTFIFLTSQLLDEGSITTDFYLSF